MNGIGTENGDIMIGIIYNPVCGKGQNAYRMTNIRSILDEKGVEYQYRETKCPLDGVEVAKELAETCDIIIAAGGDGSLNDVLNGALAGSVTKIGTLPFGSGNDVARSVGIFDRSDEELADMIANPKFVKMDVGSVEGRCFIQFLTFGIVSNIINAYSKLEGAGESAYRKALMKTILKQKARRYTIEIPGLENICCNIDYLAVQNVEYAGAGLPIHPDADYTDNKMDLIVVKRTNWFRYMLNVMALTKGTLTQQPNVTVIPITECRIIPESVEVGVVDGDLQEMSGVGMEMKGQIDFLIC